MCGMPVTEANNLKDTKLFRGNREKVALCAVGFRFRVSGNGIINPVILTPSLKLPARGGSAYGTISLRLIP